MENSRILWNSHCTGNPSFSSLLSKVESKREKKSLPADREDGRLVSPINHLIGVWTPVSFIAQKGVRDEEVK